ncbi:hypothetical protein E3J62_11065, partial [candidate division TA06 bacterium]
MTRRKPLFLKGFFFISLSSALLSWGLLSSAQSATRIEERIDIGADADSTETILWGDCCECIPSPCDPEGSSITLPYKSRVWAEVISTMAGAPITFGLESPFHEHYWDDATQHVGADTMVGCFPEGTELLFHIHPGGPCMNHDMYPLVSGFGPIRTLNFEDYWDCDWNDLVVDISLFPVSSCAWVQTLRMAASNDVGLPEVTDPVFLARFTQNGRLEILENEPVGDQISFLEPIPGEKYISFKLHFNFDAYPFHPSWDPQYKIDIDIEGFPDAIFQQGAGWSAVMRVMLRHEEVTEAHFGDKRMTINLNFTNPDDGTSVGFQTINTTLKVFFAKKENWEGWGSITNWFYYWRMISALHVTQIEAFRSVYGGGSGAPWEPLGEYKPKEYFDKYIIYKGAGTRRSISIDNANPNDPQDPCCGDLRFVQGIDGFAMVCRHENRHRQFFSLWYRDWKDYEERRAQGEDRDRDYVPNQVEVDGGLDPDKSCSHPCCPYRCGLGGRMKNDFEWLVYREQVNWGFYIWDHLDWASPGKQTDPG